jgi:uncharacterized 2Fe-2S/4Fe-4S cluster protein (DUF4445 family)
MDRIVAVSNEETVLEAAMRSGIHINASCGGNGTCGRCRITLREGRVDSSNDGLVGQVDYNNGVRLACRTHPLTDVTVELPFESQVDRLSLKRRRSASHVLSATDVDRLVEGWTINPRVFKKYLELHAPGPSDNLNDFSRLVRELRKQCHVRDVSIDFPVLKKLPNVMREGGWQITVTVARPGKGLRIINVEPGNHELRNYTLAIDIGTTTVWAQLIDTANCAALKKCGNLQGCTSAEAADYNGQIRYGDDVITRIMYSQKPGGLKTLQETIILTINGLIHELLTTSGIDSTDISHIVAAGNTTMTQLALGLDPKYIMLAPYTPTANSFPPVRAIELGLAVKDHVWAYFFPCVASYVGGDIVAGILGSGVFQREEVTLFMDIGTNGELVIGNREWLTCTSCSAGPAFEGGGIQFGMRAGRGAIEQINISPSTYEPMLLTVGKAKPAGICGSGLIAAVGEFFETGIIDQNGKFNRDLPTKRVREGVYGWEYVLCYAEETQINKDIVLTEADLDNLIRAKAAVYAGCKTLLDSVGLAFDSVERVIIAGGFGHYLDIEKAQFIGLLPDISLDKFIFVGNGSLLGARLGSFSEELLRESERIAQNMTNIELANNNQFMHEFVAAQFIPHTDESAFPNIMKKIQE